MTVKGAGAAKPQDAAERLREFGPVGLLAIVAIIAASMAGPPVGALLVLAWAQLSQTPMRTLGFAAPRSWTATGAVGVVLGIAFKLGMKALVMPLLGAPPMNPSYHYLAGNLTALPGMLAAVLVSAGLGEEVVYRGYVFERLGKLLGQGKVALTATILVSSTLFALAHYPDQRLPGVEQAAVTGLVFGGIYAWRKQLWVVIIAHAAFDLTAVALIYWGWEGPVAHLLFR